MKLIFHISGENIPLAVSEALALARQKKSTLVGNLLICDSDVSGLESRLAYTHSVYQFLFRSTKRSLEKDMQSFDWQSIYKNNFCIRVFGTESSIERKLAGFVWEKVRSPKVNLERPVTAIHLFFVKNDVICGKLLAEVDKSFERRKAHMRPEFAPISLHPKLARAAVNLTGADTGDIICDPFCGTGGILIEAGLMGLKPVGFDIDKRMVESTRENLGYYRIKGYQLKQMDALMLKGKFDFIVTDLPYGKNTGKLSATLYVNFLKVLNKVLKKKAVVIFPMNIDALIRKSQLKVRKKLSFYVHKSMTKHIYLIEKAA